MARSADRLRAFIAIDIPDELRDAIHEISKRLRKTGADARWVRTESMHLTLRFLGDEVPCDKVEAIGSALHNHLTSIGQFALTVQELGAFPNTTKPRVVWLGIEPHEGALPELYEAVERAVEEAGWAKEDRPFAAHLTLGRVRSPSGIGKLREVLERGLSEPVGTMTVEKVSLIRSTLTPQGPVYETLKTVTLQPRQQVSCEPQNVRA
jgi:2'-5' RNA ligase